MKKAKKLSRLLGLQLPTTWKTLDIDTLSHMWTDVKENNIKKALFDFDMYSVSALLRYILKMQDSI